jgi:uncharacterized RDD family membrane protein YckC
MEPLDKLTIDTPEQTSLEFPLAGIGSRFVAMAADTAIQVVIGVVLVILAAVAVPRLTVFGSVAPQWAVALLIIAFFLMYSGYFAVFEAIWNGQTPGKRYAQLRVMKDDGRPISAFDSVARNLLRIVDSLPALYGVGVITVFFSKKNKRLGDFVAGTVVVHEKTVEAARPFLETQVDAAAPSYDVSKITLDELQVIETFLQRRDSFDPALRGSMAAQIATRIGQTLEVQVFGWPYNERFLEAVHAQYRAAGRYQPLSPADAGETR